MDELYIPVATRDSWELSFNPPETKHRKLAKYVGLDGFDAVFKLNARVKRHTETKHGRFSRLLIGARQSAKAKSLGDVTITRGDLEAMWEKQGGLCYYSKIPMDFKMNSHLVVSLDRKDPSVGYHKDNCVLAAWAVNRAKNTMGLHEFKRICSAIVDNLDPSPHPFPKVLVKKPLDKQKNSGIVSRIRN